jgi:GNAT superfamily N-acetyltransferase
VNFTSDCEAMTAIIAVRPATDPERRGCRMLLPESSAWAWPAEYLVAMSDSPRQLLGAIAYAPALHPDGPAWLISLRVVRAARRGGIGARLVDALIDLARSRRIRSLVCPVDSGSDAAAAPFLLSRGFRVSRTLTTFEEDIDLDDYEPIVRSVCERLEARGRVPEGLRVVPLAESPLDLVSRLYAANLGGTIEVLEAFLRGSLARGGLEESYTLILDGKVLGLKLMEPAGPAIEVHAKIVAPEYRRGWANAIIARELVRRLRALGRNRVRFSAADEARDTLNFAARYPSVVVKVSTQFVRRIESAVE